ncbi:MAG: glycosyltransferase family 2 protein [Bacteroidales bacterium]|nr:glycosyltransferase family 2 protein [Bacteroidales bacterium]
MSDKIKISVVIPVYNVEALLPRCLDSILGQSVREIEVICVDDRTPDGSGAVLDAYAARDSRVIAVHKEVNEGPMMARETGYSMARGEYIFFCDSDDYLPDGALQSLYDAALQSGADITAGNSVSVNRQGREVLRDRASRLGNTWQSYMTYILNWGTPALWGCLFKRSLFEDTGYTAIPHMPFSEDRRLLTEILLLSHPTVEPLRRVVYCYWANPISTTRKKLTDKAVRQQFGALYGTYDFIEEHTGEFTHDNDGQMTRWLSLYIERGVKASSLCKAEPRNAALLRFAAMRRNIGLKGALHTTLCIRVPGYGIVMNSLRRLIRKAQGKD